MRKRIKGRELVGATIVFMCHDGNGNIVMMKRSQNARDEKSKLDIGRWSLEFSNIVISTLKREIKEEHSTDVLNFDFLGYRDVYREDEDGSSRWIVLDFLVLIDKGKVKIGEPDKFTDLKWFKFGKFPQDTHSQFPVFLKTYKHKLQEVLVALTINRLNASAYLQTLAAI